MRRYFKGEQQVIFFHDRQVMTPSRCDLFWPSVIVNPTGTNSFKSEVRLRKQNLYYRDECKCFFCGIELEPHKMTYEHLIPRSKGGKHTWQNTVACCAKCNEQKGDSMPTGRWSPKYQPYAPNYYQLLSKRKQFPIIIYDENWIQFLPQWTGDIIVKSPIDGRILRKMKHEEHSYV